MVSRFVLAVGVRRAWGGARSALAFFRGVFKVLFPVERCRAVKCLACAALLVCMSAGRVQGFEYSNRELGFKAQLPDGFEDVSRGSWPERTLLMKAKFNRDKTVSRLMSIQDLGEVIRQDANLSRLKNARGNVRQEKMRWREFEVDVFSVTEGDRGMVFVSLNAEVPLRTRGIQVSLSALKTEERALRHEMETLLATIEGPSNWVTSRERSSREESGTVRTAVTVTVLVALVGGALWFIARLQG
jgi:hypothetical protein